MTKVNPQINEKFDKKDRLIFKLEPVTNTIFKYKYDDINLSRTITILNEKNRSNFKTVITQVRYNKIYVDKVRKEFGDVYNITTTYDDEGNISSYKQINKKK